MTSILLPLLVPVPVQTASGVPLLLSTALPWRTTATTTPAPTETGLAVPTPTGASAVLTTTDATQPQPTVPQPKTLSRQQQQQQQWVRWGFFTRMGFITPAEKVAFPPLIYFVHLLQLIVLIYCYDSPFDDLIFWHGSMNKLVWTNAMEQ